MNFTRKAYRVSVGKIEKKEIKQTKEEKDEGAKIEVEEKEGEILRFNVMAETAEKAIAVVREFEEVDSKTYIRAVVLLVEEFDAE